MQVVVGTDHGGDALLAQPEIDSISDLKGKKVAMQPSPLGRLVLARALETVNLSIDDVELVNIELPDQKKYFKAKKFDAVVTYNPIRVNLIAAGAQVLFDSSQMPGEIVDFLIGRKSLSSQYPQQLKHLLEGWFKGLDEFEENPEESIKFMAKREGISPEQFKQSLEGLKFLGLKENQEIFEGTNMDFIEGMQKMSTFLKEIGVAKKVVDPTIILEGTPLKNVKLD